MLERTPQVPPFIAPLAADISRPLWSVMIPAFNCTKYLAETIESVLSQDQGEGMMQIEVVDDASTDGDVESLVREIGKGRVSYFRQERNVGSLRNFETCINRAHGHWVQILHGDDKVLPGFYEEIDRLFTAFPEAGAAFTDFYYMNERSERLWAEEPICDSPQILDDWLYRIAAGQRIQPPAIVVKRKVYEHLGSFFAVHYGEDWEMWMRIASHYTFAHSPKHLAHYRNHTQNITSRSLLTGQDIKDIGKVIKIARNYLPANKWYLLEKHARMNFAEYFAKRSHDVYHRYENPAAARAQAFGAFKMYPCRSTFKDFLKVMIKSAIGYKQLQFKSRINLV